MNGLIDAALGHARTILSTLVMILVAGTVAYLSIPKEAEPDINIPLLYVNLSHEGISPQDAERLLIRPMEQELRSMEGVKEMRSLAFEGGGNVVLEFDAGFDADKALSDAREKVDLAKVNLPDESEEPKVQEVNISLFPVLVVTLSGQLSERSLLKLARDLSDKIEGIGEVLRVEIAGDREELVELVIDPVILESYGLDARDIIDAVSRSNRVVAAGNLDTGQGRFSIKLPGLFESPKDILDMPVKVNEDAAVRFRDIGIIRKTFKDAKSIARINGQPAVALEVSKRTGRNIIETIEKVRALVEEEQINWPAGVQVSYSQDKSTDIRTMLRDLQNNVLSAVILVMIVIVGALGLRPAGLVGIAIPGSFLTGILVLATFGLTINIVVLFSLILAVGMLVDGAIVVTEYADRRMFEGANRGEAYGEAAKRMAWPILAATATTLAAFLPLLFWPGMVGEFMKYLPITLLATLSASLVMALIFIPTLGSVIGKRSSRRQQDDDKGPGWVTRLYALVLQKAIKSPGIVIVIAFAVLVGAQYAYGKFGKGVEFFPDVEPEFVSMAVHGRGNLSIQERDSLMRQVEEVVLSMQSERPEFHTIYSTVVASSGTQRDDEAEDIIGTIQLEFTDWFLRRPAREILAELRERAAPLAGIILESRKQEAGPPVGKPIQVQFSSDDPALLEPAALRLIQAMTEIGGFVDVEEGRPIPGIEWEIAVDRALAAKFDADVTLIGSYVRMITNGMKLGAFRPDDSRDEVDIVVRLPQAYRSIDHLDRIKVQTKRGVVPIGNFVTRTAKPKTGLLRRVDGSRVIVVKAEVADGLLVDTKVGELRQWMKGQTFDPRLEITFKGEDEEQRAAQDFLVKAFGVALFLMAIILVTQFNSFYSAFLILSAVIMSTTGVMLGLLAIDQPFGIVMSGIGVIALAGIVVNNNIVLIDTYDRLVKTANSVEEAILQTGIQRFRPVLLTSVTTILGLMPMVLGINIDFVDRTIQTGAPSTQWWSQLATAIACGLAFATPLTLLVTPSALMMRAKIKRRLAARKASKIAPLAPTEA